MNIIEINEISIRIFRLAFDYLNVFTVLFVFLIMDYIIFEKTGFHVPHLNLIGVFIGTICAARLFEVSIMAVK